MKHQLCFFLLLLQLTSFAQTENPVIEKDSIKELSPVLLKGYESNRSLAETPVAVGYITARDIERLSNSTLLPSVNAIPGVKMEERSPGSYRLNIRGSLLRSPFGVRNIKVYWNDMPFTDAGGNTYLNLVDPVTIGAIEILKGPGGSLYGANTGGVVVLHTDELPIVDYGTTKSNRFRLQLNGGSYGSLGAQAQWKYRKNGFSSSLNQSHQQADGYRDNSKLRRDVFQWNGQNKFSAKDKTEWLLLYADLYYQTPGGLTLAQMGQNPKQSRPATPTLPSAAEQKAAIYNKTFFGGLSHTHTFNHQFSNVTSVSFSNTDFKNPFITNYEKRNETNLAGRTKFIYNKTFSGHSLQVIGGMEWLYGYAGINNYGNRKGVPDTIQYKDKIWVSQWFPFAQLEWQIKKKLLIQAGASTNKYAFQYRRLTGSDNAKRKKTFDEQFLPRLAVLYPFNQYLSVYTSVSKGFSPATLAEIRPSEGSFYTALQPEFGWNYELGFRGSSANNRLQYNAAIYYFKLKQAIVRRTNAAGAEYFVNAGGTKQKGAELYAGYTIVNNTSGLFNLVKLWSGFTYNDYNFTNYFNASTDYSGNALTGVPKYNSITGLDISISPGFYLHTNLNYTSKLPLNDANDAYAKEYYLLQAKLGWKRNLTPAIAMELFAGVDNLLNEHYSLGNDINAVPPAKRYYNPSPLRNYFGGLILQF